MHNSAPCICSRFARKVDPCILPEAKLLLIFIKGFRPQLFRNLHYAGVAGLRKDFRYINRIMPASVCTSYVYASYVNRTIAGKCIIHVNEPYLQSRRYCNRFINRARLVGIADTEIPPHFIQVITLLLCRHRLPSFLKLRVCFQFQRLGRVVQIEFVSRCHRVYFTCVRVHYHCRHILGGPFLHRFLHDLLRILLYGIIQRSHDGTAVLRGIFLISHPVRTLVEDKGTARRTCHFIGIVALQPP